MTRPSAAGCSGILQMIGESTCGFVARTSRPSREWRSRAMSPHGEAYCSQNALSDPGGCLLAQCHTQRQRVTSHHAPNKIYHHEVWVTRFDALITSSGPDTAITRLGIACVSRQCRINVPQNWAMVAWPKGLVHNPSWWTEYPTTWRICTHDTVWHHWKKTLMTHLLRAKQKAYCVTPKIQNQTICLKKEL